MRSFAYLLILFLLAHAAGCGRPKMSQADRDYAIKECLDEIEIIKNNLSLTPQAKQDLIERTQLQLDELRGEKSEKE